MSLASDARRIFWAGVKSVDPDRAVRQHLARHGPRVVVGRRTFRVPAGATARVVAIGKAAGAMADAAVRVVGQPLTGLVVTPRGYPGSRAGVPVLYGEHPVPGPGSFRAGPRLLDFVRSGAPDDFFLFLLSGGASAVAEFPAAGLTPADLTRTNEALLESAAPIGAINTVRRHLSRIKGGQLAVAAGERRFATLALSDVVGDVPEEIGSGPTVPDPTTFRDALAVVKRYDLRTKLPVRVLRHLDAGARGRWPETPKPAWRVFETAPFQIVGSNRIAVGAASKHAASLGYRSTALSHPIVGETRTAAARFARELLDLDGPQPRALIGGGETIVTLGKDPGKGGRNQEFALAAARVLTGRNALVLSAGTDGIDGPTDAAGGWSDGDTGANARRLGVDVSRALARHASYDALDELGTLLKTGPTGTNVTDLHVGLVRRGPNPSRAGSTRRGAVRASRRRRS